MAKNLLYAQSGGPTVVINASAAGVIAQAQQSLKFEKILAAHYGMDGILAEDFFDCSSMTNKQIELLSKTPAAAFGSCRYHLPEQENAGDVYQKIADIFQRHNIGCFVYNGGNDSMDTCHKISKYFKQHNVDCVVVGVPKTVDNDLVETSHCPGYGSAAKYIATTMQEIALDIDVYKSGRITICEIMGRDAGWLTASTCLANLSGNGPDLIYLPEHPFDTEEFFHRAVEIFHQKKKCLVAVSEGIRDKDGNYVGASTARDSFNHAQLGGVGAFLANQITQRFGIKTRAVELSLPQRCAGHLASLADHDDAFLAGRSAVNLALLGKSGQMVALERKGESTTCRGVDVGLVANKVKDFPKHVITDDGAGIKEEFLHYLLPLIQGEVQQTYKNGMPLYFDASVLPKV